MENNPLYPPITKKQRRRQHLAYVLNRIFVTCVILSIIVNLASGGAPWCLIVIIGFFTLHTMVVSPDLLEYNRISQTIKAIILLSILFILIDLLYPGWAGVATSVLRHRALRSAFLQRFSQTARKSFSLSLAAHRRAGARTHRRHEHKRPHPRLFCAHGRTLAHPRAALHPLPAQRLPARAPLPLSSAVNQNARKLLKHAKVSATCGRFYIRVSQVAIFSDFIISWRFHQPV